MADAPQLWASPLGSGWQHLWQQQSPALVMEDLQQVAGPKQQVHMWVAFKEALLEHGARQLQAGPARLLQNVHTTRCWAGKQ
jgi:hypothetical protein